MKTSIKFLSILFIAAITLVSCNDNDDTPTNIAHTVIITANPDTEITGDSTVEITAEITDTDAPTPTPTYTYKWYKSDTADGTGTVIADATNSVYTSPNAITLTEGSHFYYVEVEDGTDSSFNPVKSNVITVIVSAQNN
jgi:hypothetical protein